MVKARYGDKLAGHVSRDATAIRAREKAAAKPETAPPPSAANAAGAGRASPAPPPDRHGCNCKLNRGKENLADLPASCDWGCKKNSKGKTECWRGHKAHLDVIDGDIPVSFILTSANLHDGQAAPAGADDRRTDRQPL